MKKRKNQNPNSIHAIQNQIFELPKIEEKKKVSKKLGAEIINRGADNKLPYQISEIVENSSTLKAVINSKSDYVSYGHVVSDNEAFLEKLKHDCNAEYDYYELSKRLAKDKFTYGYAFIKEVKVGNETFAYHLDTSKVAFADYEEVEQPESVWISDDWIDLQNNKPYEISLYPEYSTLETQKGNVQARVIPLLDYTPAQKDYPRPQWSGAMYDAQVESFIGQYNANQFENGITLSSILLFDFGHVIPEENETEETAMAKKLRKFEGKLKGTTGQRSGKSLVVPKNADVEKPEYVTYPMEKEGSYLELQKLVENNIVKACSWFRSLAGLESAGTLGNNQQLKNEWDLAERLIENVQHQIMNAYLKTLENFNEIEYSFDNTSPFTIANEININDVLTNTEKRELIGYGESLQTGSRVALNGAQVTSMVEVVSAYSTGQISEAAAIQILIIGFNVTEEEAKQFLLK